MKNKDNKFTFTSDQSNRIDSVIFDFIKNNTDIETSRNHIQKLIDNDTVFLNDNLVNKKNMRVVVGDVISFTYESIDFTELEPKKIDFKIVYEDNDIIVVDKPNNLVVHPGSGNWTDTLINGLLYYNKNISNVGEKFRPGIVHRIDKKTTGLLVVAKNETSLLKLSEMFKNRVVDKEYTALVHNMIKEDNGVINAPIGRDVNDRKKMAVTDSNSKEAITHFFVTKRFVNATLVRVKILTGRTHQIRVHFQYINHPIIGDELYSKRSERKNDWGQFLHASKLEFNHPITNEKLSFISPLPKEFNDKIIELEEYKETNEN